MCLKKTRIQLRRVSKNLNAGIVAVLLLATLSFGFSPEETPFSEYWAKGLILEEPDVAHYFTPENPKDLPGEINLLLDAYSYRTLDWTERSIDYFEEVASRSGGGSPADWAAFWLGEMAVESGQTDKLQEVFSVRSPPWGRFWIAIWLFSTQDYDSAAGMFADLAPATRGQIIMRLMAGYFQGLSLTRMDLSDSANVVFSGLLRRYPGNLLQGEIYYRMGSLAFARGDWKMCREYLDAALAFYESSSRKSVHWWADEALFLLGAVDFMEGRHIVAMRQFERLSRRFPDSPYIDRLPYLSVLAEIETRATDAAQDSALLKALSGDLYSDVLIRIGYLFMQDGDLAAAQQHFLEAADIADDSIMIGEGYLFAGECSYNRRRFREATEYYEIAVSFCEDRRREASWGIGWCYTRRHKYPDARLYLSTVFHGYDDNFANRARLSYAETFLMERDYSRAAEEFRTILDICSGYICQYVLYDLIVAYTALNDTDNVIESSRTFVENYRRSRLAEEVVPEFAELLFVREEFGELLRLADNVDLYALSRETADRVRFYSERARYHLGIYDDPLMITDKFLEKYPDSPLISEILFEVGSYLCNVGDYQKGAMTFDRLRDRSNIPESLWVEASYRMAQCYLGMADTTGASEIIRQLISEFPQSPLSARGMIELGDYFREKDLLEKAVSSYNLVLEKARDETQLALAEYRLALTFEGLERYHEAQILYKSLIQDSSATRQVLNDALIGLVRVYYQMGEYQEGYLTVSDIYDTLSGGELKCSIGEQLGRFALRLGEVDIAISTLLPVGIDSVKCPGCKDQAVLYDLSLALESRERWEDALKVWEWMIESTEDDSIVSVLREKISNYNKEMEQDYQNEELE